MTVLARPTPLEIAAGVEKALTRRVIPELQTEYARAQVASALELLHYLAREFDGAVQTLLDEINALESARAETARTLREAGHDATADALTAPAREEVPDLRVSTLLQRSDELQEALLAALLEIEREADSGASELAPARRQLHALFEDLNERRRTAP
jgi:hypothetical protein